MKGYLKRELYLSLIFILLVCIKTVNAGTKVEVFTEPANPSVPDEISSGLIKYTFKALDGDTSFLGKQLNVQFDILTLDSLETIKCLTPPINNNNETYLVFPEAGCAIDTENITFFQSKNSKYGTAGKKSFATFAFTDPEYPLWPDPDGIGCCEYTFTELDLQVCLMTWYEFCEPFPFFGEWHADRWCSRTTWLCEPFDLIELSKFDAFAGHRSIEIIWHTESELNNSGFNIYRADSKDEAFVKINPSLIKAIGSPVESSNYEFIDENVNPRHTYYYKLEDIDIYGLSTFHGPVSATPRFIYR